MEVLIFCQGMECIVDNVALKSGSFVRGQIMEIDENDHQKVSKKIVSD